MRRVAACKMAQLPTGCAKLCHTTQQPHNIPHTRSNSNQTPIKHADELWNVLMDILE